MWGIPYVETYNITLAYGQSYRAVDQKGYFCVTIRVKLLPCNSIWDEMVKLTVGGALVPVILLYTLDVERAVTAMGFILDG